MATSCLSDTFDSFLDFLFNHPRLLVLSGAGLSADSGIGTYRDDKGRWLGAAPIQHQQFVNDEAARRRYWGRSMLGWPRVHDARPNQGHQALAQLEALGYVERTVTQNVDRLHQAAGSVAVTDLHGRLDRVICLDCAANSSRQTMQQRLLAANPALKAVALSFRPDGDAVIDEALLTQMQIPACDQCGGVLKPDVVFFGDNVPRDRVDQGLAALQRADALLVVGSSLQVFSGYRFCRRAAEANIPIAIVNAGVTRADPLATLKLPQQCGPLLQRAAERLPAASAL